MLAQNPKSKIILASASPRRQELLRSLGLNFEIMPADLDESVKAGESPANMVQRLAEEKASQIASRRPEAWVIGADTIVLVDNEILGKPLDKQDAARMLALIQGRTHFVWGGIALLSKSSQTKEVHSYVSKVQIVSLDAKQIDAYIKSGEPMDKAGSYAIQGLGAALVETVEGSYTNVVGLNLSATLELLRRFNLVS